MLQIIKIALAAAVLLLILAVLVVYLAIEFLPWWGAVLFIIMFFALVLVAVPLVGIRVGKRLLKRAGIGLFKIKGNVLRGATVKVHKVTRVGVEGAGARAASVAAGDVNRYQMHLTITPKYGEGPFQFYDPYEFVLLPFGQKATLETLQGDEDEDGCELTDVKIIRSGDPPAGAPPEVVEALRKQREEMERAKASRSSDSADVDSSRMLTEGDDVQIDLEMESIVRESNASDETLDISAVEAEVAETMGSEPLEAKRVGRGPDDDVELDDEEGFSGDCIGQSELLLTWSVPRGHARRVKLFYYFNEFGDIKLPE